MSLFALFAFSRRLNQENQISCELESLFHCISDFLFQIVVKSKNTNQYQSSS